jgi:hypothetical protein
VVVPWPVFTEVDLLPDAVAISVSAARDGWAWTWDHRDFRAVMVQRDRGVPLLVAEDQVPEP